jgi:hypothetical protein
MVNLTFVRTIGSHPRYFEALGDRMHVPFDADIRTDVNIIIGLALDILLRSGATRLLFSHLIHNRREVRMWV